MAGNNGELSYIRAALVRQGRILGMHATNREPTIQLNKNRRRLTFTGVNYISGVIGGPLNSIEYFLIG